MKRNRESLVDRLLREVAEEPKCPECGHGVICHEWTGYCIVGSRWDPCGCTGPKRETQREMDFTSPTPTRKEARG
ncbi:MAG TPA: hypothetical protein VGD74_11485 [Vulgatibacter sp.]